MKIMEIESKPRIRASWLKLMLDVAASPAMANLVPAGPGSLATGQVGGMAGNGRLAREIARSRLASGGPSGYERGTLGCSNA